MDSKKTSLSPVYRSPKHARSQSRINTNQPSRDSDTSELQRDLQSLAFRNTDRHPRPALELSILSSPPAEESMEQSFRRGTLAPTDSETKPRGNARELGKLQNEVAFLKGVVNSSGVELLPQPVYLIPSEFYYSLKSSLTHSLSTLDLHLHLLGSHGISLVHHYQTIRSSANSHFRAFKSLTTEYLLEIFDLMAACEDLQRDVFGLYSEVLEKICHEMNSLMSESMRTLIPIAEKAGKRRDSDEVVQWNERRIAICEETPSLSLISVKRSLLHDFETLKQRILKEIFRLKDFSPVSSPIFMSPIRQSPTLDQSFGSTRGDDAKFSLKKGLFELFDAINQAKSEVGKWSWKDSPLKVGFTPKIESMFDIETAIRIAKHEIEQISKVVIAERDAVEDEIYKKLEGNHSDDVNFGELEAIRRENEDLHEKISEIMRENSENRNEIAVLSAEITIWKEKCRSQMTTIADDREKIDRIIRESESIRRENAFFRETILNLSDFCSLPANSPAKSVELVINSVKTRIQEAEESLLMESFEGNFSQEYALRRFRSSSYAPSEKTVSEGVLYLYSKTEEAMRAISSDFVGERAVEMMSLREVQRKEYELLGRLTGEIQKLVRNRAEIQQQNEAFRSEKTQFEGRIATFQAEVSALQAESRTQTDAFSQLQAENDHRNSLESSFFTSLKDAISPLFSDISHLDVIHDDLPAIVELLKRKLNEVKQAVIAEEKELAIKQHQLASIQLQSNKFKSELERSVKRLNVENAGLKDRLREANEEIGRKTAEIDQLRTQTSESELFITFASLDNLSTDEHRTRLEAGLSHEDRINKGFDLLCQSVVEITKSEQPIPKEMLEKQKFVFEEMGKVKLSVDNLRESMRVLEEKQTKDAENAKTLVANCFESIKFEFEAKAEKVMEKANRLFEKLNDGSSFVRRIATAKAKVGAVKEISEGTERKLSAEIAEMQISLQRKSEEIDFLQSEKSAILLENAHLASTISQLKSTLATEEIEVNFHSQESDDESCRKTRLEAGMSIEDRIQKGFDLLCRKVEKILGVTGEIPVEMMEKQRFLYEKVGCIEELIEKTKIETEKSVTIANETYANEIKSAKVQICTNYESIQREIDANVASLQISLGKLTENHPSSQSLYHKISTIKETLHSLNESKAKATSETLMLRSELAAITRHSQETDTELSHTKAESQKLIAALQSQIVNLTETIDRLRSSISMEEIQVNFELRETADDQYRTRRLEAELSYEEKLAKGFDLLCEKLLKFSRKDAEIPKELIDKEKFLYEAIGDIEEMVEITKRENDELRDEKRRVCEQYRKEMTEEKAKIAQLCESMRAEVDAKCVTIERLTEKLTKKRPFSESFRKDISNIKSVKIQSKSELESLKTERESLVQQYEAAESSKVEFRDGFDAARKNLVEEYGLLKQALASSEIEFNLKIETLNRELQKTQTEIETLKGDKSIELSEYQTIIDGLRTEIDRLNRIIDHLSAEEIIVDFGQCDSADVGSNGTRLQAGQTHEEKVFKGFEIICEKVAKICGKSGEIPAGMLEKQRFVYEEIGRIEGLIQRNEVETVKRANSDLQAQFIGQMEVLKGEITRKCEEMEENVRKITSKWTASGKSNAEILKTIAAIVKKSKKTEGELLVLRTEVAKITDEKAILQSQNASLSDVIQQLRDSLIAEKASKSELAQMLSASETKIKFMESESSALQSRLQSMKQLQEQILGSDTEKDVQLVSVSNENAAMREDLRNAQKQLQDCRSSCEELKMREEKLLMEIDANRKTIFELNSKDENFRRILSDLCTDNEKAREALLRFVNEKFTAFAGKIHQNLLAKLSEIARKRISESKSLKQHIQLLENHLSDEQKKVGELTVVIDKSEKDLETTLHHMRLLKASISQGELERSQLNEKLESLSKELEFEVTEKQKYIHQLSALEVKIGPFGEESLKEVKPKSKSTMEAKLVKGADWIIAVLAKAAEVRVEETQSLLEKQKYIYELVRKLIDSLLENRAIRDLLQVRFAEIEGKYRSEMQILMQKTEKQSQRVTTNCEKLSSIGSAFHRITEKLHDATVENHRIQTTLVDTETELNTLKSTSEATAKSVSEQLISLQSAISDLRQTNSALKEQLSIEKVTFEATQPMEADIQKPKVRGSDLQEKLEKGFDLTLSKVAIVLGEESGKVSIIMEKQERLYELVSKLCQRFDFLRRENESATEEIKQFAYSREKSSSILSQSTDEHVRSLESRLSSFVSKLRDHKNRQKHLRSSMMAKMTILEGQLSSEKKQDASLAIDIQEKQEQLEAVNEEKVALESALAKSEYEKGRFTEEISQLKRDLAKLTEERNALSEQLSNSEFKIDFEIEVFDDFKRESSNQYEEKLRKGFDHLISIASQVLSVDGSSTGDLLEKQRISNRLVEQLIETLRKRDANFFKITAKRMEDEKSIQGKLKSLEPEIGRIAAVCFTAVDSLKAKLEKTEQSTRRLIVKNTELREKLNDSRQKMRCFDRENAALREQLSLKVLEIAQSADITPETPRRSLDSMSERMAKGLDFLLQTTANYLKVHCVVPVELIEKEKLLYALIEDLGRRHDALQAQTQEIRRSIQIADNELSKKMSDFEATIEGKVLRKCELLSKTVANLGTMNLAQVTKAKSLCQECERLRIQLSDSTNQSQSQLSTISERLLTSDSQISKLEKEKSLLLQQLSIKEIEISIAPLPFLTEQSVYSDFSLEQRLFKGFDLAISKAAECLDVVPQESTTLLEKQMCLFYLVEKLCTTLNKNETEISQFLERLIDMRESKLNEFVMNLNRRVMNSVANFDIKLMNMQARAAKRYRTQVLNFRKVKKGVMEENATLRKTVSELEMRLENAKRDEIRLLDQLKNEEITINFFAEVAESAQYTAENQIEMRIHKGFDFLLSRFSSVIKTEIVPTGSLLDKQKILFEYSTVLMKRYEELKITFSQLVDSKNEEIESLNAECKRLRSTVASFDSDRKQLEMKNKELDAKVSDADRKTKFIESQMREMLTDIWTEEELASKEAVDCSAGAEGVLVALKQSYERRFKQLEEEAATAVKNVGLLQKQLELEREKTVKMSEDLKHSQQHLLDTIDAIAKERENGKKNEAVVQNLVSNIKKLSSEEFFYASIEAGCEKASSAVAKMANKCESYQRDARRLTVVIDCVQPAFNLLCQIAVAKPSLNLMQASEIDVKAFSAEIQSAAEIIKSGLSEQVVLWNSETHRLRTVLATTDQQELIFLNDSSLQDLLTRAKIRTEAGLKLLIELSALPKTLQELYESSAKIRSIFTHKPVSELMISFSKVSITELLLKISDNLEELTNPSVLAEVNPIRRTPRQRPSMTTPMSADSHDRSSDRSQLIISIEQLNHELISVQSQFSETIKELKIATDKNLELQEQLCLQQEKSLKLEIVVKDLEAKMRGMHSRRQSEEEGKLDSATSSEDYVQLHEVSDSLVKLLQDFKETKQAMLIQKLRKIVLTCFIPKFGVNFDRWKNYAITNKYAKEELYTEDPLKLWKLDLVRSNPILKTILAVDSQSEKTIYPFLLYKLTDEIMLQKVESEMKEEGRNVTLPTFTVEYLTDKHGSKLPALKLVRQIVVAMWAADADDDQWYGQLLARIFQIKNPFSDNMSAYLTRLNYKLTRLVHSFIDEKRCAQKVSSERTSEFDYINPETGGLILLSDALSLVYSLQLSQQSDVCRRIINYLRDESTSKIDYTTFVILHRMKELKVDPKAVFSQIGEGTTEVSISTLLVYLKQKLFLSISDKKIRSRLECAGMARNGMITNLDFMRHFSTEVYDLNADSFTVERYYFLYVISEVYDRHVKEITEKATKNIKKYLYLGNPMGFEKALRELDSSLLPDYIQSIISPDSPYMRKYGFSEDGFLSLLAACDPGSLFSFPFCTTYSGANTLAVEPSKQKRRRNQFVSQIDDKSMVPRQRRGKNNSVMGLHFPTP